MTAMRARLAGAALAILALATTSPAADAPPMAMPAHGSTIAVSVAADAQGALWLARVADGRVLVSRSTDGGAHFAGETAVNAVPENIRAENQNRPKIAVHGDNVAVLWAQALPKRFAGHVRFARSTDGGRSFSAPVTVNSDTAEIGHSFGALAMHADGRLAIAWLDGRDNAAAAPGTWTGSSLYYVLSGDGGATFTENRRLAAHTCQCCRVGLAFAPDGVAVAFWRHVFGTDTRDFAMARLAPESPVVRASEDGWHIDGCPHHGGDIAIDDRGRRHLAWFTGGGKQPGLYYRRIDGKRMTRPMPFGDADAQAGHPAVFARGDDVWLAWREFADDAYRVQSMHSRDGGKHWQPARTLATTRGNSDLPLFVANARAPLLYWNTVDDGLRILSPEDAP